LLVTNLTELTRLTTGRAWPRLSGGDGKPLTHLIVALLSGQSLDPTMTDECQAWSVQVLQGIATLTLGRSDDSPGPATYSTDQRRPIGSAPNRTLRCWSRRSGGRQVGDLSYLNSLYAASEDPWHLRSGWYDDRKHSVVLAALPYARFDTALQLGCSDIGLVTGLAGRSELLTAIDFRAEVVNAACDRATRLSNVSFQRTALPHEWPYATTFDLIVFNEVGYYLSAADWAQLASQVRGSLGPRSVVVACHSRRAAVGRTLETETVHGLLDSILGHPKHTQVLDVDFVVDVWTTKPPQPQALDD
jgi:hypothetical protein